MHSMIPVTFVLLALVAPGCSGSESPSTPDVTIDAGPDTHSDPEPDAGPELPDAGPELPDAGPELPDAGPEPLDNGPEPLDNGPEVDAVPDCDPPLVLEAPATLVATLSYSTLIASGGTGNYRFEFIENGSNAFVNELTGAFLAGDVGETNDVIRLTDTECSGAAELTLTVVSDPVFKPGDLTVPPGACLQFTVSLGSGEFLFEMGSPSPVGSVTADGFYQTTDTPGTDVIVVTDVVTGRNRTVQVTTKAGTALALTAGMLAIPLGGTYEFPVALGSGSVTPEITEGAAVTLEDGRLVGAESGTAKILLTDDFVQCVGPDGDAFAKISIPARVIASLEPPWQPYSDAGPASVAAPGDLDGDGFPDAVVGLTDNLAGGRSSGAVMVFRGMDGGMDPVPAQTLATGLRDSDFGQQVEVADVTGDGELDLLVSALRNDKNGKDSGSVYLFPGVAGGFFEEVPSRRWDGTKGSDDFGSGLALCDFDGDGDLDMAVGAPRAEDEDLENPVNEHGGVFVFLAEDGFLPDKHAQELWGRLPDGKGGLVALKGIQMGHDLAAGDFDGDGRCDLAVGVRYADTVGSKHDGAVLLFRGVEEGLSLDPVRIWAGQEPDSKGALFGLRLEMGDVNGDGKDDLLVGQRRFNSLDTTNQGAVRLFLGHALTSDVATTITPAKESDWVVFGTLKNEEFGADVALGDVDGDQNMDVLIGGMNSTTSPDPYGTGAVFWYRGNPMDVPDLEPSTVTAGRVSGDRFGSAIAVVGDLNGDGWAEMITHASHDDADAINAGRVYAVWGTPPSVVTFGSEWAWHIPAEDPGDAWKGLDYDDSEWAVGIAPIGWGDEQPTILEVESPTPTGVLFRKTFEVVGAAAWARLSLSYDDGVIVWVNEELVALQDSADPPAFDGYSTKATNHTKTARVDFEGVVVPGQNVIAVMLKPGHGNDAKATFDLSLQVHPVLDTFDAATQGFSTAFTVPLAVPIVSALTRYGQEVAVVDDITGDGLADLLVGAPGASLNKSKIRAGAVYVHAGTAAGGFESEPTAAFEAFPLLNGNAQLGESVAGAGDFHGDGGPPDVALLARSSDRLENPEGFVVPEACSPYQKGTGAVFVFSATTDPSLPHTAIYGPQVNQRLERVAANFDLNGDGKSDIAYGSDFDSQGTPNVSNLGGFGVVYGRSADPAGPVVICEPDLLVLGLKKDDVLGQALVSLGDVNGDGCDELAIGAPQEGAPVATKQGTVRVLFGFGPGCTWAQPRILLLAQGVAYVRAGIALAGGHDVDGDGIPDLVVGGPEFKVGNQRYGAAWLISGAWLKELAQDALPLVDGALPADAPVHAFKADGGNAPDWIGTTDLSNFGRMVALVPVPGSAARVAVGEYLGAVGGTELAGGAHVFQYGDPVPVVSLGGESWRPEGDLGFRMAAGLVGGKSVLVVATANGTPFGQADRIDEGTVYVIPVE